MVEECDFLIIGGGVGGYNAAKRLRRLDADARIVMISADELPPYDLPPLSKELLRGVKTEEQLVYPSLESLGHAPIAIRLSTTVTALDPTAGLATTTDFHQISFRSAVLATGGSPIRLPIPGATLPQVYYLRTVQDCRGLVAAVQPGRRAVVIGAGFIGVEVAASLRAMGVEVLLVEATDRIWPRFADADLAARIQARCEQEGVRFLLNARVVAMAEVGGETIVETAAGDHLACDFVVVGVGIRPNVALAEQAGLTLSDGIVVDEFMRTSAPNIYAIGDVASYPDPFLGRRTRAEHWGHAEYTGQIAALNMLGTPTRYDFLNYAWSDVFDLHIESAGHHHDYDTCVVRGDPMVSGFTNLYFRAGRLLAYTSVNGASGDLPALRRLIKSGQAVPRPSALAEASTPVKLAIAG